MRLSVAMLFIFRLVIGLSIILPANAIAQKRYTLKEAQEKVGAYVYRYPDSASYYLHYLIRNSKSEPDTIQAKHLNNLGLLHSLNTREDSAKYYYERAIEIGSPRNKLGTMINLAVLYKKDRNYRKAIAILSDAVDGYQKRNDEKGLGMAYGELGSVYSMQEDRLKAIELLKKGIAITTKYKMQRYLAIQQQNLANIYYKTRNYAFAKELYEDCLPYLEVSNDKMNHAIALANYGSTLFSVGNTKKADAVLQEASTLLEPFDNDRIKAIVYGTMAAIAAQKKDFARATSDYEKSYRYILSSKSPESLSVISGYIAMLNRLGNYSKALTIINTIESKIDLGKCNEKEKLDFYKEASNTLLNTGQDVRAVKALKDVIALKDTVSEIEINQQIKEIEAKYQSAHQLKKTATLKAANLNLSRNADSLLYKYRYASLAVLALAGLLAFVWITQRKKHLVNAAASASLEQQHRKSELELRDERTRAEQNEEVIRLQQQQLLSESLRNVNYAEQLQLIVNDFKAREDFGSASKIEKLADQSHWTLFMEKFNAVNPYFIHKLSAQFPQLNQSELQFCALVRVNLSYKEIANILQITHQSVFTKKYRVKKKMALEGDGDFLNVIRSL
jgi:tetratricopeptide (TPR) repeat protein